MKMMFSIFVILLYSTAFAQSTFVKQDTISSYFTEIEAAANTNKKLWDKDLYGPMLFVVPATRLFYSNAADTAGVSKPDSKIYYGILPEAINIANMSVHWSGRDWAMIMLPLPENKEDRINLMAHELFHKAQPSLKFITHNADNNHLDQKDGRVYLRLELEALKKAIQSSSVNTMKMHLKDALTFRKYRNTLYPGSDSTENLLELNEGIAEYTGYIFAGRDKQQATAHFEKSITDFLSNPTFVRSFAYQTIPVYGYLLSASVKYWNMQVTAKTNLADYFISAFGISLPSDLPATVKVISRQYNVQEIFKEEIAREERIKKLIAEYKNKFIEHAHFELQFVQMNVSFDPRNIMPLEDKGSVYPNIRVSDKWGILTVENGALMSPNWDKISVTLPIKVDGKNISGEGWTLVLNDRYTVVKDENSGKYKLVINKAL